MTLVVGDLGKYSSGLDGKWRERQQEYLLVVADDGYTIASGPEFDEEEAKDISKAFATCEFVASVATDCLNECTDLGCACNRVRNPQARDAFLKTAARRVAEVCAGNQEGVSYASLGCGLLRFDLCFLERLLAIGVPVSAAHLVDHSYDANGKNYGPYKVAIAQFATWFATRNVDVYVHSSIEKFALRVRKAKALPVAILQVDCSELTWVFEEEVMPMCEEVLQYGGLFCSLTARESTTGAGGVTSGNAYGEVWRLSPETGRLKLASKLCYKPGEAEKHLSAEEPLPPAACH